MSLVTCNFKEKVEHCKQHCLHGDAHETLECSKLEMCNIAGKKVKCRKLYKKELKILKGVEV